jgi:hypothetical protein
LQGGLVDLAVGSEALNGLSAADMPVPVTAISGSTAPGTTFWAYDSNLQKLWAGLSWYCETVPDASYITEGSLLGFVFPSANDRIVSINSQLGFGDHQLTILNVDHATVLKDQETITRVKEVLENP